MNQNTVFCCKGKRLANYLISNGCKIIRIDNDQRADGYLVFIFVLDEVLKESLEKWKTDRTTYLF